MSKITIVCIIAMLIFFFKENVCCNFKSFLIQTINQAYAGAHELCLLKQTTTTTFEEKILFSPNILLVLHLDFY